MQKEVGGQNWIEWLAGIVMSCFGEICYHQTVITTVITVHPVNQMLAEQHIQTSRP